MALVLLLSRHRRGLNVTQILERWDGSRATLYRDMKVLREAGVPLESHTVSGEARHTLWGSQLPPLGPSPLQISALRIARRALIGLDGTGAATEIDKLLAGYARALGAPAAITFAKTNLIPPDVITALDRAVSAQRQTRIRYRSVQASRPSFRNVDPLGLRYSKGDLYFIAYDHNRASPVPFKVARISHVEFLRSKCPAHPKLDIDALFADATKIWAADPHAVRVRLHPDAARFAREYPLHPTQTVTSATDGSVIVDATVNGITEAMRWVLSWGKNAEALEPEALRQAVATEVQRAAAHYEEKRTTRQQPVSQIVRRTGPTKGESTAHRARALKSRR